MEVGYDEGSVCNRDGCMGIIQQQDSGGCSCHINPPCSSCCNDSQYCGECGWENLAEQASIYKSITPFVFEHIPIAEDDGKLYVIKRYFDDHYEMAYGPPMKKGDIYRKLATFKQGHYVSYRVREADQVNEIVKEN